MMIDPVLTYITWYRIKNIKTLSKKHAATMSPWLSELSLLNQNQLANNNCSIADLNLIIALHLSLNFRNL